jgi:hypothetical protein
VFVLFVCLFVCLFVKEDEEGDFEMIAFLFYEKKNDRVCIIAVGLQVHLKVKQANKASGTKQHKKSRNAKLKKKSWVFSKYRIGTITYLAYGFGCRSCLGT